jgi:hypothetical protein
LPLPTFTPKAWEDEPHLLKVLQGTAKPTSKTPVDAEALENLELRLSDYTDEHVQLITQGSDWSDGDNQAGYAGATIGRKLHIVDGKNAAPSTGAGATAKVVRTSAVTQETIDAATGSGGSDGGDQLGAIMGVHVGKEGSETQTVGLAGFAMNRSSTGVNPDACGVYGVGRITAGTSPNAGAFGGYFWGMRDVSTAKATGIEVQCGNFAGVDGSYAPTSASDTKGIWMPASGNADSGVGVQLQNVFGQRFKVGIGIGGGVAGGKTGAIVDSSIRDDSAGEVSLDIRGTHAKAAISVAKGSGPVVIGAQEMTTTTSQLLELHAGGTERDPVMRITAGGNVNTSILFNNFTSQYRIGQAGVAGAYLTGSAAGDGIIALPTSGIFHIGRNSSRGTLRVGNNVGIGAGAADSFGGGVGVVFIANAGTVPATNPSGGGVLYASEGKLFWRGSAGTVKEIATA